MTVTLALRPAHASDAEPICLIYNQGIEDRVATLETPMTMPTTKCTRSARARTRIGSAR